jgi:hypothetical protein
MVGVAGDFSGCRRPPGGCDGTGLRVDGGMTSFGTIRQDGERKQSGGIDSIRIARLTTQTET